jgi:type IV pilus assembly protein PilZ
VRKRVDLPGTLHLDDDSKQDVHISDMCPGGAFVELETPPPFGSQVKLAIKLPSGHVVVDATVRWAKGVGVGVQFGLLGVRQTYAITEHLADLEPLPDSRR